MEGSSGLGNINMFDFTVLSESNVGIDFIHNDWVLGLG